MSFKRKYFEFNCTKKKLNSNTYPQPKESSSMEPNGKRENAEQQEEILLQPYTYITQIPGKNIRSKLSHGFNYWLNIPQNKLLVIEDIIQMLHNASLLLDDIQDNSILRRGIPVAHSIFGVPSTINSANYVVFLALQKVLTLEHPDATRVYVEQLLELYRGQGMEIYWRDCFICPSEKEYELMTIRKTGGLFMMAIRLMQLFSNHKADFTRLSEILGLSYQILDDYQILCSKDYCNKKSFAEDIAEGKFSFPIIHAIHSHPEDSQIMHILRQRTKNVEVKQYCISLLEKYGSFDYTRKKLEELHGEALSELEKLGKNPLMNDVIAYFFRPIL